MDEYIDTLGVAKFFSTLETNCGYWQIEIDETDQDKTLPPTTSRGLLVITPAQTTLLCLALTAYVATSTTVPTTRVALSEIYVPCSSKIVKFIHPINGF